MLVNSPQQIPGMESPYGIAFISQSNIRKMRIDYFYGFESMNVL